MLVLVEKLADIVEKEFKDDRNSGCAVCRLEQHNQDCEKEGVKSIACIALKCLKKCLKFSERMRRQKMRDLLQPFESTKC